MNLDLTVFITGITGQLGYDVALELTRRHHTVIGSGRCENPVMAAGLFDADISNSCYIQLDITDRETVLAEIKKYRPDAVIHCAAWTNVDEGEGNCRQVFRINADGTRNVAEAAKAVDARMIYISTDYVFDGTGKEPWKPDCKDFGPLNVYGASKLAGERAVKSTLDKFYIVRTAWIFGLNGKNFIKTMIQIGKTCHVVRVVDDQIGTPTYTKDLARLLADMAETDRYGFYHATNEGGFVSWADLAEEAYRCAGMNVLVNRVTTAEYGASIATRPYNSRLDKSKLVENGFKPLPDWKNAVERYIIEAGLADKEG